MLFWQIVYSLNKYITQNILNTEFYYREYTFGLRGLFYKEGLIKYFNTLNESFNVLILIILFISLLFTLINYKKNYIFKFVLVTFIGYLLLIFGDYEHGQSWYGYGRFILMPFASLLVMYIYYVSSIKNNISIIIQNTALYFVIAANIIFATDIENYSKIYSEDPFYDKYEYVKFINSVDQIKSNLSVTDATGIIQHTIKLIGHPFINKYTNDDITNNAKYISIKCFDSIPNNSLESELYHLRSNYICKLLRD